MTSLVEFELTRAAKAIEAAPFVALACHITPDGDALGSMLAMFHLCQSVGKPSVMSWPMPFVTGKHYRNLPGLTRAVSSAEFPGEPALMMTFDCGSMSRLHELSSAALWAREHGELIVVDHHATNDRYGTINPIDVDAAATAVVVRKLAHELGWPLGRDSATCLFAGLVTDTGRFQYNSTTPAVFALAEELATFDLPISRLTRELFEEHSFAYLQVAGRALSRAVLDPKAGFVYTWVPNADLIEFGVGYEEIEGLIDWLRTTTEAEVCCVAKETPGEVRVSLRSLSRVDVGAIATALGGGGHRLAAGFSMRAPVADVITAVRAALPAC